jgi:hypothetical protein
MRLALLLAAIALAPLAAPARPAAACTPPPVPVFPGARQIGGLTATGPSDLVPGLGGSIWATDEPLLSIQQFYIFRLTGAGWSQLAQLPGQHPGSFASGEPGITPIVEPVLEFSRNGDRERVRITAEAGGYSIWLECRDD